MTIQIKPVSEIEGYIKILLYGDPGVGKTRLAATAPGPVLFINIEGGMLSVADTDAHVTEQLHSIDDIEEVFWHIAQKDEGWADYKTVVIDSGTELQTVNLEEIVAAACKKAKDRSLDDIYIEDYGKSTARLKRVFRQYRDLPCNVIITALVRRIMPPASKKKTQPIAVLPQFTEKLASSLMGYMDCAWYMDIDPDGNRCLLTQTQEPYKAKTRGFRFSEALGPIVKNPNLTEIYDLLIETEASNE